MNRPHRRSALLVSAVALALGGCAIAGGLNDPLGSQAELTPPTKSGVVLDAIPPPAQALDVAVYNFPDLTGQNKENDNFAEFSRAVTQGAASILTDVLDKAGEGKWFNVVERNELNSLIQERQIIQNTRTALYGKSAEALPALRFAGVVLDGGIIGYDTNDMTGGAGVNYLGVGGFTNYRRDIVTVALRAVSVQTGRVLASVTTTQTVYSAEVQGAAYRFAVVNQLLQVEAGITRNQPATIAVREGIQLAVYALIFEGVRNNLWTFKNPAVGAAFMKTLDDTGKAVVPGVVADAASSASKTSAQPVPQVASAPAQPAAASTAASTPALAPTKASPTTAATPAKAPAAVRPQAAAPPAASPGFGSGGAAIAPSIQGPIGRGGITSSSAEPASSVAGATVASADAGLY